MLKIGGAERATCGHKQPFTLSTNPLPTYPACFCSPLLNTPGPLQSLSWDTGLLTPKRDAGYVAANWAPWRLGELVLGQSPKYSTWIKHWESGPRCQILVCGSGTDLESEKKRSWRSGVKQQLLWSECLQVTQRCLQQEAAPCQPVCLLRCLAPSSGWGKGLILDKPVAAEPSQPLRVQL